MLSAIGECALSDSLINVSDRYIDLDSIKEDIQKTPRQGYTYRPLSGIGLLEEQPHEE